MKKIFLFAIGLGMLIWLSSFTFPKENPSSDDSQTIKWYTFLEAVEANKTHPRKIFVDVYTDWCGWCKRMDATTFKDPKVVEYLNSHYYPVKFNAEQKETITYQGHTLKFVPSGRRGAHELAVALLDGRMSYPSYVFLDEKQQVITRAPGYRAKDVLMRELKYIGEEHFKNQTFEEYVKEQETGK